jgi:type II secretory pathway component PulF
MTISLVNPDLSARLSAAESAELAARLRALAASGLALEGGLRALAEEVGSSRLAEVLSNLAARLERGEPLAHAIDAPDCRLPVVLRGMILAGVQSGRLPEVLEQFAALDRRRNELRHRLFLTFAYPAILLNSMAVLLILFRLYVVDEFGELFTGFRMMLPPLTAFYLNYAGVVGWTVLGLAIAVLVAAIASLLPLGSLLGRFTAWIPIIGPVAGNERYFQFTRLMATLLDAQAPLPDALNVAATAMRGTMLEGQCRTAAAEVEAGMPLVEAFARARYFDSLTCLVDWGQKKNALADAFRSAAEMFEARSRTHVALLNMIVLPAIFVALILFVALAVLALLMPMISMMQNLSSGGW